MVGLHKKDMSIVGWNKALNLGFLGLNLKYRVDVKKSKSQRVQHLSGLGEKHKNLTGFVIGFLSGWGLKRPTR